MTDFMSYYKGYWKDLEESGRTAVGESWHTQSQSIFDKVHSGDDLWVIVQQGEAQWKLLQRIHISKLAIEEETNPNLPYGKFHMIGDPAKAVHFDLAGQPDFARILKRLQFANGQGIRHIGRLIGRDFQSLRELSKEDSKLLHDYEALLIAKQPSFWWVNHKQTYRAEIEGGYIWSPKTNQDGSFNQTYLNLTSVRAGDIVFSYANTKIGAVGVATSSFTEQNRPFEFGKAGDSWASTGLMVPIKWHHLETPISPKDYIDKIAPLLPSKNSPLQKNGNGNQKCYLASISKELGSLTLSISDGEKEQLAISNDIQSEIEADQIETTINFSSDISETEKDQLIKARNGQGKFRSRVEQIEKACRITHLANQEFLIASHIKPWKDSSNEERLDGYNGLLLSPHIDKLFDRGWISFTDDGYILCSNPVVIKVMGAWGIDKDMNVGVFSKRQCHYLEYHREVVYKKKNKLA
jgi:putative restriction endonuclease